MAVASGYLDRVVVGMASTPGVGPITVGAPLATFRTFAAAGAVNGGTYDYALVDGTNWEFGVGTYSATGPTFTRTTILGSSAAGGAINATAVAVLTSTFLAGDAAKLLAFTVNGVTVGINRAADGVNTLAMTGPLYVAANAATLDGQAAPAPGDSDLFLNKNAVDKSARLIFRDAAVTKAQVGLLGDDNLHCALGPSGASLTDRLVINGTTGQAVFTSASALFTNPSGNFFVNISKNVVGSSCGFALQDNFSGRAQIGLLGNDDTSIQTSPDGSVWTTAMVLNKTTGALTALATAVTSFTASLAATISGLLTAQAGLTVNGALTTLNNGLTTSGTNTFNNAITANSTLSVSGLIDSTTAGSGVKVKGINTGGNFAAGEIGEVVSASVAAGAAVSLTSGVGANITSMSLTAGLWLIMGAITTSVGATTETARIFSAVSDVSATLKGSDSGWPFGGQGTYATGLNGRCPLSPGVKNFSSTTTVYLVISAEFTVSTMSAFGSMTAVRIA